MKKILLVLLVVLMSSCGIDENKKVQEVAEKASSEVFRKEFSKARIYNDSIVAEQNKINTKMRDLQNVLESQDSVLIYTKLEHLKNQIDVSIKIVDKLGPYKGDNRLRKATLETFNFYKKVMNDEVEEMIAIRLKGVHNLTPQELDRLKEINIEVGKREAELDQNMRKVQDAFSKEHGATVEENESRQRLDAIRKHQKSDEENK